MRRRVLMALGLGAAMSLSLLTAPAEEGHFEAGYETAATVLGIEPGYTVFYVCSDRKPHQGTEKCPNDKRLILEAADRTILQQR